MVNGPTVLRSGIMSTELILCHDDGRVRVIFQHGPAYPKQSQQQEGGTKQEVGGLPSGLKFIRAIVSREALRPVAPSQESEQSYDHSQAAVESSPVLFFRPVPPYKWYKKWSGNSTTWGELRGEEEWHVEEMEEADAWHGRPTGDTLNVWSMRLPGGILIQCPRFIASTVNDDDTPSLRLSAAAEPMRLAWLPNDDTLLRLEASVFAMDQAMVDDTDGEIIGFLPPRLAFLRTDQMVNVGELVGTSLLERQQQLDAINPNETVRPSVDSTNNYQWH